MFQAMDIVAVCNGRQYNIAFSLFHFALVPPKNGTIPVFSNHSFLRNIVLPKPRDKEVKSEE